MEKRSFFILLFLIISLNNVSFAQNIQVKAARNAVAKIEVSAQKNEPVANQINLIKEGLKAAEAAKLNRKTRNYGETWALLAYLYAYQANLEEGDVGESLLMKSQSILDTAIIRDKEQVNLKYINAAKHNIVQKKVKLGNLAFRDKNYESSLSIFKDLSNSFPSDTLYALNGAVSAIFMQRNFEAFNLMKRAADHKVLNVSVYQFLGNWYAARQEIDKSIQIFEQGLNLNPGNLLLNNEYINVLLNNRRFSKATNALKIALAANPNIDRLHYMDGYIHQQNGDFKSAELAFDKAIDLNGYFYDAYFQLGLLKIDEFKAKKERSLLYEAEYNIQRAYNLKPNNKDVIKLLIDINTYNNNMVKVKDLTRKLEEQ